MKSSLKVHKSSSEAEVLSVVAPSRVSSSQRKSHPITVEEDVNATSTIDEGDGNATSANKDNLSSSTDDDIKSGIPINIGGRQGNRQWNFSHPMYEDTLYF